jgi:hypothetical protein
MCAVLSGPIEPRIRRRMPVGCRRAAKRPLCQRLGQYGRRSGAIDEAIGAPGAVTAAAGDAAAARLFDHLVGRYQQYLRHGKAE